jgi:hypothetical protein
LSIEDELPLLDEGMGKELVLLVVVPVVGLGAVLLPLVVDLGAILDHPLDC